MKLRERVLFFGRSECEDSKKAVDFLNKLGFQVDSFFSKSREDILSSNILNWSGEYIFCFRSLYILPKSLIDRASKAAVNFHPGPPQYPGSGCLNFALYEDAEEYGVTCHFMDEKIDSGKIIKCHRFKLHQSDNVESLLMRTHTELFNLFLEISEGVATGGIDYINKLCDQSRNEKWSGKRRQIKSVDDLSIAQFSMSKDELERLIRATYTPNYPPKIILHGYEFFLRVRN